MLQDGEGTVAGKESLSNVKDKLFTRHLLETTLVTRASAGKEGLRTEQLDSAQNSSSPRARGPWGLTARAEWVSAGGRPGGMCFAFEGGGILAKLAHGSRDTSRHRPR